MSPKKQLVTNPNIFEVLPHTYGTSTIFVNAFPYGNKWDVHWYLSLITTKRTCNISFDANDVSNKLHAKIRGERHNLVLHNLVVESNIPYDTSLRGSLNILLKNTPKKRICFLLSVHESPVPSILEKKGEARIQDVQDLLLREKNNTVSCLVRNHPFLFLETKQQWNSWTIPFGYP